MSFAPPFARSEEFPCPEFERWAKRFPKATRPLEAWAREFCVRRNDAGHGAPRDGDHHVWSAHAHLAFASILLPMLVRAQLVQRGYLELTEPQQIEYKWIEAFVGYGPFEARPRPKPGEYSEHPWQRIHSEGVLRERLRRHLSAKIDEMKLGEADDA